MREYARYKKFANRTVLIFAIILGVTMLISGIFIILGIMQLITSFTSGSGTGDLEKLLPSGTSLNNLIQ